jgi:hypothetical protein
MLSVGEADAVLKQRLYKFGLDWDESLSLPETTLGRATLFPCNRTLIRLKNYPTTATDHGIIAHEIFHAVDFLLERIGIKLSGDSGEAYAYLIGYVTQEVYKLLN